MKHLVLSVVAGAAALSFSGQAQAAVCADGVNSTAFVACSGYVSKNHLSSSPTDIAIQNSALLTDLGFAAAPDYKTLMAKDSDAKVSSLGAGGMLSFPIADQLYGETYIGIHWGGPGGGQTAFYKFNFLDAVSSVEILINNPKEFSSAVLYSTEQVPIPEPTTWALMIAGFAIVGMMMRRRKTTVSFA